MEAPDPSATLTRLAHLATGLARPWVREAFQVWSRQVLLLRTLAFHPGARHGVATAAQPRASPSYRLWVAAVSKWDARLQAGPRGLFPPLPLWRLPPALLLGPPVLSSSHSHQALHGSLPLPRPQSPLWGLHPTSEPRVLWTEKRRGKAGAREGGRQVPVSKKAVQPTTTRRETGRRYFRKTSFRVSCRRH